MFEVEKTFRFEAGHVLAHHDGKCCQPHGHSYLLQVKLRSKTLIKSGAKTNMVQDFKDISDAVNPMVKKYFDHQWINETLATDSPTAEFIAHWVYQHLKSLLPALYSVTVWETTTAQATYYEPEF